MPPRPATQPATVFAQALGVAVVTASQRDGVAPTEACARLGIDPEVLGRPDARVTHDELCRAWAAFSASDESFGLRAALLVDAAPQSLVEYTLASAGDVRGAVRAFLRFQRLLHDAAAHTLEEGPAHVTFRFALAPGHAAPSAVWDYLAATTVLRFRRAATPPREPTLVRLVRPPPADDALARSVFRAPIRYGEARAEIDYPRALLDARMSTTDPTLFALLAQQLERALGLPAGEHRVLPRAEEDVLARVRRELRTAIPRGDATLDHVARAVGHSARSLQRRLSERGTSFQAIVDAARRAMAEELLGAHRASVTEAAFAVGFADVAAFTRAFKRWTGVPPGEWSRRR
ncbi:AraC family transcriptional regulator ligand-binding domain-containing protein [Sorangium sp. So ce375]|uniref:AraC family transcriptional regulator n=1 Tax=Sorangium sp. So ce375 TaxID=3133306 RepID=UPI003F5C2E59